MSLFKRVETRPGDGFRNEWHWSDVVSVQNNKPFPVTIIVHFNTNGVFYSVQNCKKKKESAYLPSPTKIVMVFLNGNIFPSVSFSFPQFVLLLFRRSRSRDRRRSRSRERRRSNSRTRTRRSRSGSPTKSRRDER